ncbi:DUF4101 domain-containing protein, partial [Haematococcus lacustris]
MAEVSGSLRPDQQDVRKRAVRTIRELLRPPAGTADASSSQAASSVPPEFVAKLVEQLTCEELVLLLEWDTVARNPGAYNWLYPGLLEVVAAAHIEVKQAALGASHDASALSSLLVDPLLGEMTARVASFKADGWFMKYKLHKLKVLDIDTSHLSSSGGFAIAAVQLDESATLCGQAGAPEEQYRSAYVAKYQVVKGKAGAWRIAKKAIMMMLLLGLGWLVSHPLVAQARVFLALGWQLPLLWPVAQLQWAPLGLPMRCMRCAVPPAMLGASNLQAW